MRGFLGGEREAVLVSVFTFDSRSRTELPRSQLRIRACRNFVDDFSRGRDAGLKGGTYMRGASFILLVSILSLAMPPAPAAPAVPDSPVTPAVTS